MVLLLILVMGMLVYGWIVYPAMLLLSGEGRVAERSAPPTVGDGDVPSIAIIFSAHNEESVILKRLENLAALDYPSDHIQVFVGIDGGTDRTAGIALEWAKTNPNVHVIVSPKNHGKTAMLKKLVESRESRVESPKSKVQSRKSKVQSQESEVSLLVFTDANTFFAPDALRHLVSSFGDPKIGGVCGRLIFLDDAGTETRENLYWRVETLLKMEESRLDSCLGANGAIYAIRPELFWSEIPDSTIIDDFVIGMKVREQGFRMVYEPQAMAYEQTPALIADEWRRRVRIGAGAFQALAHCCVCLSPRYGKFALFFWSHKILRWFTPHLMILLAVVATVILVNGTGTVVTGAAGILAAGAGFVLLAVMGRLIGPSSRLKAFEYFLSMQTALFAGFLRYCRGGLKGTWERTERGG